MGPAPRPSGSAVRSSGGRSNPRPGASAAFRPVELLQADLPRIRRPGKLCMRAAFQTAAGDAMPSSVKSLHLAKVRSGFDLLPWGDRFRVGDGRGSSGGSSGLTRQEPHAPPTPAKIARGPEIRDQLRSARGDRNVPRSQTCGRQECPPHPSQKIFTHPGSLSISSDPSYRRPSPALPAGITRAQPGGYSPPSALLRSPACVAGGETARNRLLVVFRKT